MAARPPVAHYRLSRKEYQNTVYDLLGVHYDPTKPGELNEDTLWHGYERIGSELSLSPSHVDRYYRAAEIVLDRAFPATSAGDAQSPQTAAELRYGGGNGQYQQEGWTGSASSGRCVTYCIFARGRTRQTRSHRMVRENGSAAQRAVQSAHSGQRDSSARRPAGTPEDRQGDRCVCRNTSTG
jgi:hypothetical protein